MVLIEEGFCIFIVSTIVMAFLSSSLSNILDGVLDNISTLNGFVKMLENRVRVMNNEIIKIDLMISQALDLKKPIQNELRDSENFVEEGKIDSRRD